MILPEVKRDYGKLKLYINGKWIESKSTTYHPVTNPAKGEVIAEVPETTKDEIDMAVDAAQSAFEKWKNVSVRDRARIMWNLREAFDRNAEEIAKVLTQDHGRTIGESRGSVRRTIENIESACSTILTITKGEHIHQLATGIDESLVWEPVGVFLIITPINIPVHAWSSFVPYALASGCSVIVSPSPGTPVASEMVFKTMEQVEGFPPGVFNLIHGGGAKINNAILSRPEVKGVGFIGSSSVGKQIYKFCGELGKRASINGNGKNHIVIMPDADLSRVAEYLMRGCFGMTGQRCLGTDNVILIGDAYKKVKDMFLEAASKMKVGYGLDDTIDLGPMTIPAAREKVINFIETGIKEGAKVLLDGRNIKVDGYPNGYYLGPTILDDVHIDMHIAKEESFGPVANLIRADNLDQVIEWINTKTNYGHSACLLTSNGKNARKFIIEVNAGNIGINLGIPQPYAFFPLGSKRDSFYGIAHSRMDSIRLFMDQKTVTYRWV